MRKIWYALGILILGAGVIFLGYYLRPKNKLVNTYLDNTPLGNNNVSVSDGNSGAPQNTNATLMDGQGFKSVFKEPILAYSVFASGTIGVDASGRIWSTDGKTENNLSSTSVPFAFDASISYDGAYVLIALGDNQNPQFRVWNSKKNTWRFLPSGISSPVFSPGNHNLAYLENIPAGTRISTLNLDSTATRGTAVTTLPLNDLVLKWVSADKLEIKERGALLAPSSDFIFSIKQKTVTPVVAEKNGLDIFWDPSGKMALALLGQARGGGLFLIDTAGEVLQTLNILTLPEKCAWDGDQNLYCAMPQNSESLKIALPDEFYKESRFAYDNFYKIDTGNGNITPIQENKDGLDAESLAVRGDKLYFINRLDRKLYFLSIPK